MMMKPTRPIIGIALALATTFSTHATVLLDDTFADGTRNTTSFPTDAAWFASNGSALTASPGLMTLALGGSAVLGVSYFTPNSSSQASLGVGDALITTVKFDFNGVAPQNSSQGFRFAVCKFGTNRVAADFGSSSSQGGNVQAYGLFQNMGGFFNNANPMDIRKRTNLAGTSLLGTSGDWTSLGSGPGDTTRFPGFISGTQYVFQLSLQRTGTSSIKVTVTWLNTADGTILSTSTTDTGATNFDFDGIALRPQTAATSSTNIVFNEIRVELVPAGTAPTISTQPQEQSVLAGQNATFYVVPSGSEPLSYQWYYDDDLLLTNATGPSLTITNAQLTDIGGYSVVVTNDFGSMTSESAALAVSVPTPPSIVTQPQSLTVLPGQDAVFSVTAGGSAPFTFQWYYNTNTLLADATSDTLTISNVQPSDAGSYSVVVSNIFSSVFSTNAILSVNSNPVAPTFVTQPASQVVLTGGKVSFTAEAIGTATINYQWFRNGVPIAGANLTSLSLTNVQSTDAGSYTLTASNSVGGAISGAAILTVTPAIPVVNSAYNLTGFGLHTTGGGVIPETDPAYVKVTNALDLATAIRSANKTLNSVKVIEIMNDLDLGWNEVGPDVRALDSNPFRQHPGAVKLHPRLLGTGVSLIDIKSKNGLTIFSANGAAIRHACFNIKDTSNIIVRNLKFDELWEWDEASKGDYDGNDWDFIDLGNAGTVTDIWIDHCTFTKSYDGEVDIKQGSSAITFSWCKYTGDDGATNTNSWVRQQINYLEQSPSSYPMYNFLRTHGFSVEDIVTIIQGHDKTHLIGANDGVSKPANALINAQHTVTFHHDWFNNPWDRLPRLRGGSVHNYNIFVDDTAGLAAKRLRDAKANAMSTSDRNTLNSTYSFNPFLNGSISTENGAVLVEKSFYRDCLTPLRNNQTDPSIPAYTGKIKALDTIYQFDDTVVRGNSTDPGSPLGPFQAPIIPFSWNTNAGTPNGQLPYDYTPDDPAQLEAIVTSPTDGAGAGVLTWGKTNWLMTTYPATAPFIVAQPDNVQVNIGDSATFSVFAGGSATLTYQWYFNTNTPLPDATNAVLTLTNVQAENLGVYSVVVTNLAGTVASTNASLFLTMNMAAAPQLSGFVYDHGMFSMSINGDAGHDYVIEASTNLTDWIAIFTNIGPNMPFVWSDANAGSFNRRYYRVQIP
jgi:pectate lyase